MSIQAAFSENGLPFPMNLPESGWDGVADTRQFDNGLWVVCPYCFKKQIKILPETKIHMMPYVCKSSKCRKEFIVNV